MKMKRKILAIALTVCMVLGFAPGLPMQTAHAINFTVTTEAELLNAIANSTAFDKIILGADIALTSDLTINNDVEIRATTGFTLSAGTHKIIIPSGKQMELSGKAAVTGTGPTGYNHGLIETAGMFTLAENASVTVFDSGAAFGNSNAVYVSGPYGQVEVKGGSIREQSSSVTMESAAIYLNGGSATVHISVISANTGIVARNNALLTVLAGTISGRYGIVFDGTGNGVFTMSNGTVSGTDTGLRVINSGASAITGGSIQGGTNYGVDVEDGAVLSMSGCSVTGGAKSGVFVESGATAQLTVGTLSVANGVRGFDATMDGTAYLIALPSAVSVNAGGTVRFTLAGADTTFDVDPSTPADLNASVSGHTVTLNPTTSGARSLVLKSSIDLYDEDYGGNYSNTLKLTIPVTVSPTGSGVAGYGWTDISASIPSTGVSDNNITDMSFISDNEGWLTAHYYNGSSYSGRIYHTTDGGATFEVIKDLGGAILPNAIHMISSTRGWMGSQNNRIYYTSDGGTNWTSLGSTGNPVRDITVPQGSSTGYGVGDRGTAFSFTSTAITSVPTGLSTHLYSVSFVSAAEGWLCGSTILRHFTGGVWTADQTYATEFYSSIFMTSPTHGCAVGDNGKIITTSDGINWIGRTNPDPDYSGLHKSFFLNSSEGWAVGDNGTILHTTDGGINWQEQASGTKNLLRALQFTSTTNGYAAGNDGTLLRFTSTGSSVGKSSPWAQPWLEKAARYNLIPDCLKGMDMTQPITRAEFAALSVKLYEALSGQAATPAQSSPFTDTVDTEVLKAFEIGITGGTSLTTFSPNLLIPREQAATMLTRAYKAAFWEGWTLAGDLSYTAHTLDYSGVAVFADNAKIAAYAKPSVYFMVKNNIIVGVGNNMFAPNTSNIPANAAVNYGQATREVAAKIAVATLENLGNT